MVRTTVLVPEEVRKRLKRMAAERGVSVAAIIREALEEKSASERPKPKNLGIGDSGRTDISRLASERIQPRPRRIGIVALDDSFTAADSNDGMPEADPWR
jgi:plasmid stability protein